MKTLMTTLAFAVALIGSSASLAHDNDGACLTPGAQVVDAGASFSFTPTQLTQFEQQQSGGVGSPGGGGMCTPSSCGIVDDHWSIASMMIAQYCQDKAPGSIPQVLAPTVFNDPVNHHVGYTYSGRGATTLTGRCVYCRVPLRATPATGLGSP
ncbi:MAG: hypothetical protein ACREP7_22670 [Lysobacter sp.]